MKDHTCHAESCSSNLTPKFNVGLSHAGVKQAVT